MSSLEASPRSSRVVPTPPVSLQEGALHHSTASDVNKTNPTSPRHAQHTVQHQNNISPSSQGYSNSRSTRSNIHDILSADTQSSSLRSPLKRPYSTLASVNNPSSLSEQPSKRSRENSPSRQCQGSVSGQQQTPAYALAGSGHNVLTAAPQLLNPSVTDDQGRSRKVSLENSPEGGPGSVSDGSAEPDSSPSSSHQDRERGYSTNPLPSGHQQTPQERPTKKRNFANRTKTGCMTCRERKKKCDEGKPLCKNCERGGFKCKGYMQAGTTFRRSGYSVDHQAAVAPARSVERDTSPFPAQQTLPHHRQDYHHHLSMSRGEEEGRYMSRGEPAHEGRHSRTISSTESGPAYAPLQNQALTPAMQHYDPRHPRYAPLPSDHASQVTGRPTDPMTRYAPHDHAGISQAHKENMLRGWSYDQNDQLLQAERLECQRTTQHFNLVANTSAPHEIEWRQSAMAIFEPARRRQSILSLPPRQSTASNPTTYTFPELASPTMYPGYLGKNVSIEKGFECDYGYNIRIANGVEIRANCYIEDAAVVDIGPGTSIGRDVVILTSDPEPYVPGRRPLFRSRGVVIGEGCHIGARVTIMPGTHIAPGTRVRPGATIPEPVLVAAAPPGVDMRMAGR